MKRADRRPLRATLTARQTRALVGPGYSEVIGVAPTHVVSFDGKTIRVDGKPLKPARDPGDVLTLVYVPGNTGLLYHREIDAAEPEPDTPRRRKRKP